MLRGVGSLSVFDRKEYETLVHIIDRIVLTFDLCMDNILSGRKICETVDFCRLV